MSVHIDTSQVTKLGEDLKRTSGGTGAKASAVIRKAAFDIEARAKAACPVDTGFLRNSISTTVNGDGRFTTMSAEVGPTAEYGVFVELGTSRMGAQPYLAPAFDAVLTGFQAAMAQLGGTLR